MSGTDQTDIDAGRKVLARFSPLNVGLSYAVILLIGSYVGWQSRATLPRLGSASLIIGIVVLLLAILALSGPIVALWRMFNNGGAAVWVQDNRLYWSPWGSISLDDLTGVRRARYTRGSWSEVVLDRRSSFLSPTIHTGLYDISRDDLIRAIEALKPGLRYPDEPV